MLKRRWEKGKSEGLIETNEQSARNQRDLRTNVRFVRWCEPVGSALSKETRSYKLMLLRSKPGCVLVHSPGPLLGSEELSRSAPWRIFQMATTWMWLCYCSSPIYSYEMQVEPPRIRRGCLGNQRAKYVMLSATLMPSAVLLLWSPTSLSRHLKMCSSKCDEPKSNFSPCCISFFHFFLSLFVFLHAWLFPWRHA